MTSRRSGVALVAAPVAIATVAVLLVARHGAYASPDSAFYVGVARSLRDGLDLVAPPGSQPLAHFPPLFPALLAAAAAVLGVDPLDAAEVANPLLFGATALVVGLVVRHRTGSAPGGALAAGVVVVSRDALVFGASALSEPLFALLAVSALVALAGAITERSDTRLAVATVLVGLACLTRYAGAALVVSGAAALLRFEGRAGRGRAGAFAAGAAAPLVVWLLAVGRTNRHVRFHLFDLDYWTTGVDALFRWVVPAFVPSPLRAVVAPALGVALWRALRRRSVPPAGGGGRRSGGENDRNPAADADRVGRAGGAGGSAGGAERFGGVSVRNPAADADRVGPARRAGGGADRSGGENDRNPAADADRVGPAAGAGGVEPAGARVATTLTATVEAPAPAGADPLPFVVLATSAAYLALLVADRLVLDDSGRLDGRFLLPLHVLAVVALAPTVRRVLAGPARRAVAAVAGGLLLLHGVQAASWAVTGLGDESVGRRGLAARAWRESPVLAAVAALPPGVTVYTNGADAVFLHTGRAAALLPAHRDLLTGAADPAYAERLDALARQLRAGRAVVVVFPPLAFRDAFLASAEEVAGLAPLETVAADEVATLYRPA